MGDMERINAAQRAVRLELSLRTIAILHRESTAYRGFCVECGQEHPCVTRLEALAPLDGRGYCVHGEQFDDKDPCPGAPARTES